MSVVLRSCLRAKNNVLCSGNVITSVPSSGFISIIARSFNDDKFKNNAELSNGTILIENGLHVQELPVVIRKLRDISEIDGNIPNLAPKTSTTDSLNYHLIQTEFQQCVDLRDVFSLLSKCTKITPNIALGAMERIYDLEKDPSTLIVDPNNANINSAKGAILDKLLKVVMKTDDTQTILNALKAVLSFMEPYKHNFCDELLVRAIDNKLSIEQLCEFSRFLISNKNDVKYSETVDKLWVAFVEKETDIDEKNILQVFNILSGLKASKRTILNMLEQKLSDLWFKINVNAMQDILNVFVKERYLSIQSFAVLSRWFYTNIHALDEDSLLDIISKFTKLKYTDDQVEKAVEKYMKFKGSKIQEHVLVVGVLNYCVQFQIRNENILNACSEYFLVNSHRIPHSFLKSFIHPFGLLYYDPVKSFEFWKLVEQVLHEKFEKMNTDDLCLITLSCIYNNKYPLSLVSRVFKPEYMVKVNNSESLKKLHLIDTALSLECKTYTGPLLPKDQWSKPTSQDGRIKNIIGKIKDIFQLVAGRPEKVSTGVIIPNIFSDETYMIDIMIHPANVGSNTFNWMLKSARNENIAILIHLPDHYCSDNIQLVGPQIMRKKHLRILGMRVVSLKYALLSQYYTSFNTSGLKKYVTDCIENAESCL